MKRALLLAALLMLAGCGDDDTTPTDRSVDAALDADLDAALDADLDAGAEADMNVDLGPPPITYSGGISLLETKVLNPGTSGTFYGQGLRASIRFVTSTNVPAPTLEELPGSPLGCKAWEYTDEQALAATVGQDEGIVLLGASGGATPPRMPACVYTAGLGYDCPEVDTAGFGGTLARGAASGTATLTDLDQTFTDAGSHGRYVRIRGAAHAANDGEFPIVALADAHTLVYANAAVYPETLPVAASHVNVAGLGAIPGVAEPGFLADENAMAFTLTPSGGGHFPLFTASTSPGGVGDDFTVDLPTRRLLNAMPFNGAPITLGCDAGSCGGGSATGMVVDVVTTDALTAGLSPFAMPLPTTERIEIRCVALAENHVTIPAAYSALLMAAGITRIQTTLARPSLMGGGVANVSSSAGHALVGFTNAW